MSGEGLGADIGQYKCKKTCEALFTLVLHNLSPQTPPDTFFVNFYNLYIRSLPGDGLLQQERMRASSSTGRSINVVFPGGAASTNILSDEGAATRKLNSA